MSEKFASLRVSRKGSIELHIAYNEGYDEKVRTSLTPDEARPIAEAIDKVVSHMYSTPTNYVRGMVNHAVSAREQEKQRLRGIIERTQKQLEELESE